MPLRQERICVLFIFLLEVLSAFKLPHVYNRKRLPPIALEPSDGGVSGSGGMGFGSGSSLPRPKVITPSLGSLNTQLEKFLMMYTCKICNHRNAQMVSKVAYNQGMVVSTCRQCKSKHLIADNEGKLDMAEYGKKIEDYLVNTRGEKVQRMTISAKDLENNYLVDYDGAVTLVSKDAGQLDPGVGTVIDLPANPPDNKKTDDGQVGGFKTERVL